jgi:hypothetical protein
MASGKVVMNNLAEAEREIGEDVKCRRRSPVPEAPKDGRPK